MTGADLEAAFAACRTERLVLRRPVRADLGAVFDLHSDPATNRYNPTGPDPDLATSSRRLDEWLDHWAAHRFGYWTALTPADGTIVGFTGLRHDAWQGRPILNLYYRFGPATWGRGLATEAARLAVALAGTYFPTVPVVARTTAENVPSQRTALAAGLTRRPDLDGHDGTTHAVILVARWPSP